MSPAEAEEANRILLTYGMAAVRSRFPQYTRQKIQRAISDHIDRLITHHRRKRNDDELLAPYSLPLL